MIVIGCPYTGMAGVRTALEDMGLGDEVVGADEVRCLTPDALCIQGQPEPAPIDEVRASFLRYPYDIIPPHSSSFALREQTEAYKSLALPLDPVALNPLAVTWMLRNRAFSLREADRAGAAVPTHEVLWAGGSSSLLENGAHGGRVLTIKAAGNCFVGESLAGEENLPCDLFRLEEDDGDEAWILPASRIEPERLPAYLRDVGAAFVQALVTGSEEYRLYLVGGEIFILRRRHEGRITQIAAFENVAIDRSADRFEPASIEAVAPEIHRAMGRMSQAHGLGYLCADVIVDMDGGSWMIDVNPYGSLPPLSEHAAPTLALAKLLARRAQS